MADVTSTARLIVTVEGEGKIKALAAQIKALQALSGSKRIGGVSGPAQMVAQNVAMKNAASQMAATQLTTTRLMKPVIAQQAALAKTVAPLVAGQVATAKFVKAWTASAKPGGAMWPGGGKMSSRDQAIRAGIIAEQAKSLQAMKAAAGPMAAIARAQADWKASRGPRAGGEAALLGKMSPGVIESIKKRNPGRTTEEVLSGWATGLPPRADPKAAARTAKAEAKTAKLAEKVAEAHRAHLGKLGAGLVGRTLGLGAVGGVAAEGVGGLARVLGPAAVAAVPIAATAAAMAVGFRAANKQAESLVTNAGKAMKSHREIEEINARQLAGETVFGKGYGQLEKGVPKLLSAQRAKRGIAGEKGIMARLGLDPASVAAAEAAGKKLDAYDIGTILAKKREQLERAITGAPTPQAKADAQKKLDQFWKDVGLLPQAYTRAAAFGSEALEQNRKNQEEIQRAYGAGLANEKTQLAQAQQNVLLRGQINAQVQAGMDRIGTEAMPGANAALAAFNQKMMELGPSVTSTLGKFSSISWQAVADGINAIDTSKLKTAFDDLNKSLSGDGIKLDGNAIAANVGKVIGTAFAEIDWSTIGIANSIKNLVPLIGSAIGGALSGLGLDQSLGDGIDRMIADFKKQWKVKFGEGQEGATPAERADIEKKAEDERKAREAGISPDEYRRRMEATVPPVRQVTIKSDSTTVTPTTPTTPGAAVPAAPAAAPPAGAAAPAAGAPVLMPTPDLTGAATTAAGAFNTTVQSGISEAGRAGGEAFSSAAKSGLSEAGSAAGSAFNSAVNASSIGQAIGAAAAAAISKATVTVNVAGAAGQAVGGGGAPTGGDKP